jgi:hypothetical protein
MLIKYIVLSESNHYGWVGGFTTLAKAKRLLKIETETFYIFHYCYTKKEPFMMKIRYPIGEYYDSLSINEYKEEVFAEDDDFVIITYNDTCDKDCLILTHKP